MLLEADADKRATASEVRDVHRGSNCRIELCAEPESIRARGVRRGEHFHDALRDLVPEAEVPRPSDTYLTNTFELFDVYLFEINEIHMK